VDNTLSLRDVADGAAALVVDGPVLLVVALDRADWSLLPAALTGLEGRTPILVGVSSRPLPDAAGPLLDALTLTLAPGGPGRTWVDGGLQELDAIRAVVAKAPYAAVTLASLLPVTANASVADGLVAESLAYSMLLGGPEFLAWRQATPRGQELVDDEPVLLSREGDVLSIELNRPERHNAFGRAVRDGLLEGLRVAALDPAVDRVVLSGRGRSFCSGGDLDEFGTTPNIAAAHVVRLQQSAGYAIHQLRERVEVQVHGACIGAGIEVPAFAGRVVARDGAWFMLPELRFGLVPGAGGTVSMTHRIGPWRTAYLALTGCRLDLDTALAWGLVDARA
jgi:hypothetical protein